MPKIDPEGPKTPYPRNQSAITVFEAIAKKYPNRAAIYDGDQRISYRDLNMKANQMAHCLQAMGVKKQHFVGVYLERSIDLFVSLLGLLKAGAIYVPIDASYPMARKQFMIEDTNLSILITRSQFASLFPQNKIQFVFVDEMNWQSLATNSPKVKVGPRDIAYINYTSGTTGNPKGVLICHQSINRLVINPSWIHFSKEDRFLQISNISFDAFVHEAWGALLNGAAVCIYPKMSLLPDELGKFIQKGKVTQIIFTARLFNLMIDEALKYLKGVRAICSVGEAMSAKHAKIAFEHLPATRIINACGHTENTTHTTAYTVTSIREIESTVPIGKPINNTSVYVLDAHQKQVPFGQSGELCTGGDGVALGYLNRPDLTAEKFIPNPFGKGRLYRTGDLVQYLPDGNLIFLGRIDTQVKIRGFRIELSELEEVVRKHPSVADCVAVTTPDAAGSAQLLVYAEGLKGKKLSAEDLREWMLRHLPPYMLPHHILMVKKIPMTPNGKIDKKALPLPRGEERKGGFSTKTEEIIAGAWQKALPAHSFDGRSHFFQSGGDSIHAMLVASHLKRELQKDVSAALLFQHPILADLGAAIDALPAKETETIAPRLKNSPLPLSFSQESLWLTDCLSHVSKLQYMVLYLYRIQGAIDVERLRQSLEQIVHRHEILRSLISSDGQQHIEKKTPGLFVELKAPNETQAKQILQEQCSQGMDLTKLPLFQVLFIKVRNNLSFLGIRVHHIIFDVLSFSNLFKEWTSLYAAQTLPPLPIQYGDYAVWQRSQPLNNRHLEYWKKVLDGAPDLLELPYDHPRPAQFSGKGALWKGKIPQKLCKPLRKLSCLHNTTLSVLLFAAFKVLLYRYSGKEDIVVGSPFANRTRPELDPLIGYFVQMFVLRTSCKNNPSFLDVALSLHQQMLACYEHADVPFEAMVGAINPERNPGFHPLFQVLFVYENITKTPLSFGKARLQPLDFDTQTAKFDLTLFIYDLEDDLECQFEYCTDLFEQSTIAGMFSHFCVLLEGIVRSPNEKIGLLPLLPKFEKQKILQTWNETGSSYPKNRSIVDLFEEVVKRHPRREALRFRDQALSYSSCNAKANQIARYLQKQGVRPSDLVGVYMERSLDLALVILAIVKAGAVYVPIDASYPEERKRYMIEHTGIKVLITKQSFAQHFHVPVVLFDKEVFSPFKTSNLKVKIGRDALAYITYTSGSTGAPKGVQYPHLGLIRLLKNPTWMKIGPKDRMLQISNISFDMLAAELWGALLNGACLCIYPQMVFAAAHLGQFIVENKITHLYLTARLFALMVDEGLPFLKHVRMFGSTGEAMSASHAKKAHENLPKCQIVNAYGPTETHIATTHTVSKGKPVTIGHPVQGTKVYILDAYLQPVPIGVYGELYIGGDALARGYLKDPQKTQEKFISNPFGQGKLYRTGDWVRYLPDGAIEYSGRIDKQVKISGFRIELSEVEEAIKSIPRVSDCVVVAKEMAPRELRLVAYVEAKGVAIDDLRKEAALKLPQYAVPSYFVLLDQFPLTQNGKIDEKKLPPPLSNLQAQSLDAPMTDTEQKLMPLWSELLKVSAIGRSSHFFHLGGHSILAMQLHSLLKEKWGQDIPVSLIFEAPVLSDYAKCIDALQKGQKTLKKGFDEWREEEAQLDPRIQAKGMKPILAKQYTDPRRILLTGATGFVGAFLLRELLEHTKATVYCLVRRGSFRVEEALKKYSIWKDSYKKRIVPLEGSLEEPLLGLKHFDRLSRDIDSIFHVGALVNHAMSFDAHRKANVLGTEEVIRLAAASRLKPLYFISTVAVVDGVPAEMIAEDADIATSKGLTNGYVQSKWVSERMLSMARSRGIASMIFRLPRVGGDSKTGAGPTSDFLWRLVQAALLLKKAPETDLYDDLTPVDFVCKAIRIIATQKKWMNRTFHVMASRPFFYRQVFQALHLPTCPGRAWLKLLMQKAEQSKDERLMAIASLLADVDFSKPTRVLKLRRDHLEQALQKRDFASCEMSDAILKKYLNYYRKTGYFDA